MSEKVTIPAEVADVIENLRDPSGGHVFSNAEIIALASKTGGALHSDTVTLQKIAFDTLLAALVNGYERERAPEEYVRDLYRGLKEEAEFARTTLGTDYGMSADRARRVMERTLNALGIKIEGVNA